MMLLYVYVTALTFLVLLLLLVVGTAWNEIKTLKTRIETMDKGLAMLAGSRVSSEENLKRSLNEVRTLVDAAIQAAKHRPGVH